MVMVYKGCRKDSGTEIKSRIVLPCQTELL